MTLVVFDRVKERVFVVGVGAVQVGSAAPTGFQNFPAVMTVDGPTSWICIADTFSGAWEVSVSGLIAGDMLERVAENVLSSSSGPGVLVNFPGNVCDVFMTVPAAQILSPSGLDQISGRTDPRGLDVVGWDGSLQARIATDLVAAEFVTLMGGVAGIGATVFADSPTSANVDLNLIAKGAGAIVVGNYNGRFLNIVPPANPAIAPTLTLGGTADGLVVSIKAGAPIGYSGVPVVSLALCPQNNGALQLSETDGTAAGGNARGANAVDLQCGRSAAAQVASGHYAFATGFGNTVSATGGSATGFSNLVNGQWSAMVGQNGSDRFRYGFQGYSTGFFAAQGDAQIGRTYFRGRSTAGAIVTLTADAAAQSSTNCLPIASNSAVALRFSLTGRDRGATGTACAWFQTGLLTKDSTAGSTTLALGTATTLGTAPTVAVTADTTNSGLLFRVTPGNAHDWDFVVAIDTAEVQ